MNKTSYANLVSVMRLDGVRYWTRQFCRKLKPAQKRITDTGKNILRSLKEDIDNGEIEFITSRYFNSAGGMCVVGYLMKYKGFNPEYLINLDINKNTVGCIRKRGPKKAKIALKNLEQAGLTSEVLSYLQVCNDSTVSLGISLWEPILFGEDRNAETTPHERVSRAIEILLDEDETEKYLKAGASALDGTVHNE